ncbi:MAG: hypothetical protein D6798_07345 [Deltaproteobacteria bacterium]|nr:MAG: hypothetical protein D6798_07345 [Deltaproteobacteria bacterium]
MIGLLVAFLACTGADDTPAAPGPAAVHGAAGDRGRRPEPATVMVDQHQQHPPLPADNPAWQWEAGGFVPDFGWYGEHSWADVRMRVAGHIYVAGRDLARLHASGGDLAGCADAYDDLRARLEAIPTPGAGVAHDIHALLVSAATRDAALCRSLARGTPPAADGDDLATLRARLLGLALRHDGGEVVDADAARIRRALRPFLEPRPDLDLDTFRDVDDRHRLRVALFQAALSAEDPLSVVEPWGYWEPAELQRTAIVLGLTAQALCTEGCEDWSPEAGRLLAGDAATGQGGLDGPAWTWPSQLAAELPRKDAVADFTVEGLGHLPTGDSLIDVAAEPGPRAIGTLERLGLDDPVHRAWLGQQERRLDAALAEDPAAIPGIVREMTARIDAMGHGSRYYNIKQIRNEAVRQLAAAGHPSLARTVLADNWPLHAQDWACPNREAILRAIDGRLLLAAGDPTAEARLQASLSASAEFLDLVDRAERGEDVGRHPPGPGAGPRGQGSPPSARPIAPTGPPP